MAHTRSVPALTLDGAKAMVAAAEAEALRNQWNVAIAIVDAAGGLILFHRLENTQPASLAVAIGKARTAATFKRPTKLLEESVAGGRFALLAAPDVVPMQGGLPVTVDSAVIGAIGVSGVKAAQDEQVAQAGLSAFVRA
jgi:glc operon protein GlcG